VIRQAFYLAVGLSAFLAVPLLRAATSGTDFQDAVAALQRGDAPAAEQKLRVELKANPDEVQAMSLLGVALDNQKKFPEADEMHRQAMAKAPDSAGVLNNYGNHLLLTGDPKSAHDIFLKAVALDPADDYANLQLAQVALQSGNGPEALQYLDKLPAKQLEAPNMAILRLQALDLAGNRPEADALFNRLAAATENDAAQSAALASKLVQAGQFEQAETFLTHALAPDPTNFNLLYELGVVASRAGHNERARDVLENALRRQPQNVDVLYGLAFVYRGLKQSEQAVRVLSQATRLSPQRPDVWELLAIAASDIHAYEDSVAAWDRYVALKPDDDAGRRERGFARANVKQADAGMADLEWYVGRHPDDPTGFYELGVAQAVDDPEKGLVSLNKAVALKPDFVEARSARGAIEYQQGKAEPALSDLEFAVGKLPDDAIVLDRLGQTYLLLDRLPDALRVLRKAAELNPGDPKMQLHVANALAQAGQTDESRAFMNRYRELGGAVTVPARGVMDFLSLTPEEQHAAYRGRLEKAVKEHPEDVTNEVLYMKFLLGDGKTDQAVSTAQKILALKPGPVILADAGHTMLTAGKYQLAGQLLELSAAAASSPGVDLDLAIAGFYTDGAAAGLQRLDRIPEAARTGDYYVARGQMLEAAGKTDEAISAMAMAVKAEPERVDLYWQAAALMTKNQRAAEALKLLNQAATVLPQEPQIAVMRAAVEERQGMAADSQQLLSDSQHRWPESAAVWVEQGMISAGLQRFGEARKALETAVSLGAHSPETFYALAWSAFHAAPSDRDAAATAIAQALKVMPEDAQAKALAAQIHAGQPSAGSRDENVDPAKLFLSRSPKDW